MKNIKKIQLLFFKCISIQLVDVENMNSLLEYVYIGIKILFNEQKHRKSASGLAQLLIAMDIYGQITKTS